MNGEGNDSYSDDRATKVPPPSLPSPIGIRLRAPGKGGAQIPPSVSSTDSMSMGWKRERERERENEKEKEREHLCVWVRERQRARARGFPTPSRLLMRSVRAVCERGFGVSE